MSTSFGKGNGGSVDRDWNHTGVTVALCTVITLVLIAEFILNCTPPISRDALIHHLAIPKLWLRHGGFYEMPWAVFSYYPMNIDLLYLGSLYFHNDVLPKFIHCAFGIGIAFLIYSYLNRRLGRNWALLGVIIFFTTPLVIRLATAAYVDLGMVFFITASVMSWIKWRDTDYRTIWWLVLSAACMGLAAGSKHNAPVAWFFVNLALVFCYSRDTKRGASAVKYGAVFFGITLLVVSPWYIKNVILMGNPIYPLFDGLFQYFRHVDGSGVQGVAGALSTEWSGNIFQRRYIMFGEGFWEVLLVPVRMFFQGRDYSAQYFDGVLNPLLFMMVPFAFLGRNKNRDAGFFIAFSLFFMGIAYFLTAIRVRYILPIIPFLTILTVVGIRNIVETVEKKEGWFRFIGLVSVVAFVTVFISFNIFYLKNYWNTLQPLQYVLGEETKEAFLSRHVGSYPAIRYINDTLPQDARVFLMFLGGRGYYLERDYWHEPSFGMNSLKEMVQSSKSEEDFQSVMQKIAYTHVLLRTDMFDKFLRDNYSREEIVLFFNRVKRYWKPLFGAGLYAVYEISLD